VSSTSDNQFRNCGFLSGHDPKLVQLGEFAEEQREIVKRVQTGFSRIDRLASDSTSARKLIDHLDQAILAKDDRPEGRAGAGGDGHAGAPPETDNRCRLAADGTADYAPRSPRRGIPVWSISEVGVRNREVLCSPYRTSPA
jgi:hypothetical protein